MHKKDRRLFLNTVTPLLLEVVTIISGFIVPRLILSHFGSNVNGLVQSITQFLAIISFLEMGVGSVIRFNLYKPLANHDNTQTSKVIVAANKFFRTLALILLGYTMVLMVVYPFLGQHEFDSGYTALLIAAMCISSFAQYYLGQVNQILLTADQKGYIQYVAQIITIILNTVACVVLIELGAGIHMVKLSTSMIYLLRPLFLQWYVRKNYSIDYKIKYTEEPIQQKWNGVAQHISAVVLDQTDVIVLTVLSTLANVSIYAAYNMIVAGIKKLVTTATSGIQAKLGDIIARENNEELQSVFAATEWIIHTVAVFLFGCTLVLVVPFIMVYTRGVTDANYNVPVFAVLITLANASHSLRLPYSMLILTAGHYKQTQHSYLIAAGLNIIISIALVYFYGLIGVAIGTLVSMSYQTVWMAWYSYKNILKRNASRFCKQILVDTICLVLVYLVTNLIQLPVSSYINWFVLAASVAVSAAIIVAVVNLIFYGQQLLNAFKRLKRK